MNSTLQPRVLLAAPAQTDRQVETLRSADCEVVPIPEPIAENMARELPNADAVCLGIIDMPGELFHSAPRLQVVARQGSGTDMVDVDVAAELGIWVTNTPGANANAVAEFTIGVLIGAARNIVSADRRVKGGGWRDPSFFGPELERRTVALFGLGKIGRRVARLCAGFGMTVRGYDPYVPAEEFEPLGVERCSTLAEATAGADALLIHAAPGVETERSVNGELLATLKRGAILVNVARAEFVDDAAVLMALKSGQLHAAALDVFGEEPPTDRSLADHPRVIATPHSAAWSYEARERMTVGAAEEVVRCLKGEDPSWPVNRPLRPRNRTMVSNER